MATDLPFFERAAAEGADVGYPDAKPALQAKALVINKFDHTIYGHLRVTANAKRLRIEFDIAGPAGRVATTVNALTVPVVL